jgi:hypothetical protein
MTMDLAQLTPVEDGVPMEVVHPETGQVLRDESGQAVTITLLGEDSEVYQSMERASTNRRLKQAQRGRRGGLTAEQLAAEALELVVACTVGWSGVVFAGGVLAYSEANARKLYTALPWLRRQVEQFIADAANFFGSSKTS